MTAQEYQNTPHFKAAQEGTEEAKRIFNDKPWPYTHGLLAELLRLFGGDEGITARELLEQVRTGAEMSWTLANPNRAGR